MKNLKSFPWVEMIFFIWLILILSRMFVAFGQASQIKDIRKEVEQLEVQTKVPEGFQVITLTADGYQETKTPIVIQSIEQYKKSLKTPVSRGISQRPKYTQEEIILMAKLVHAEAEGEPFEGKVLVASVVMNRQKVGGWYGDTIKQVVFKKGQFDGINRDCFKCNVYTEEDIKAVQQAENVTNNYMFFVNLKTASDSKFIKSKSWILTVGNHSFAEDNN